MKLFCGLVFVLGVFFSVSPSLPSLDLPQHAAVTAVLAFPNLTEFSAHYRPDWAASPYIFYYFITSTIARLTGSAIFATHFIVGLTFFLYSLLCVKTVKNLRISANYVFVSLAVYFNCIFYWGFAAFQASCVFAFVPLLILMKGPLNKNRTILLLFFTILTGSLHAYGLVLVVLFVIAHAMVFYKSAHYSVFSMVIALGALKAWSSANSFQANGQGFTATVLLEQWNFTTLQYKLNDLVRVVFEGPADRWNQWLAFAVLVFSALTFLFLSLNYLTSLAANKVNFKSPEVFLFFATSLALLAQIFLYFALPIHLGVVYHINLRAPSAALWIVPFWLFSLAGIARHQLKLFDTIVTKNSVRKRFQIDISRLNYLKNLEYACLFTGIISFLFIFRDVFVFGAENQALQKIIGRIPSGSSFIYTSADARGEHFELPVFLQQASYIQAKKGGFSGISFAHMFPHIPIRVREDVPHPRLYDCSAHGSIECFFSVEFFRDYKFVIFRGETLQVKSYFDERISRIEDFGSNYFLISPHSKD